MSQKVIAIIDQNEFLKSRVSSFKTKQDQFEVELTMLNNMIKNKQKDFDASVELETEEIVKYLKDNNMVVGDLNGDRHIIVALEENAIYLCDHSN